VTQPKEFWLVAVPPNAGPDTSLQLVDVKPTRDDAIKAVESLQTASVGRVAVLERVTMFDLEMAVRTVESEQPVTGIGGPA
jgi:hypothetical protein